MTLVHGTAVVVEGAGVLIVGPSGSGKSDLALRLIDAGGVLIADDQVDLVSTDSYLVAQPPAAIAGRMELRGVGICAVPSVPAARLHGAIELGHSRAEIERLPEPASLVRLGVALPLWRLDAFEVSTAAKVRQIARALARRGA
jgi:serine kinase of HPr protein (carbohydrate metabolism regulator)